MKRKSHSHSRKPFWNAQKTIVTIVTGFIAFVLLAVIMLYGKSFAVLDPKGIIATQQRDLIIFTVFLGMFVIVPVFVLLFVFAYKYRASNKGTYTPDVEGNRIIESIWWFIPVVIITVLGAVTWKTTHDLDPYRSISSVNDPIKVHVVSLEWRWLFIYPEQGVATINELRIPEKTPIEFDITADSPMSAFWIPSLGSQTYAMTGMTSKLSLMADSTGTYRGSNSNISGEGYAKMDFGVISQTESEFNSWVSQAKTSKNGLDWSSYQKIMMQSKDSSVKYYSLKDASIQQKIVAHYMGHDMGEGSKMEAMDHSGGMMHHGGMSH